MKTYQVNRDKGIQEEGKPTIPVFTEFQADENDPKIIDLVAKGHLLDVAAEAAAAAERSKEVPADDPPTKAKK